MPRSAHKGVISDSDPLIALGRLDLLRLLPALFTQVPLGHSNAAVAKALVAVSEAAP